jgi:exosortase C (VPDSG-CTERM-specific)
MAWVVAGTLVFAQPLFHLMVHASRNSLHSHIPLIPVIAAYLLVNRWRTLPPAGRSSVGGTLVFAAVSVIAVAARQLWGDSVSVNDGLVLTTLAYVSLVVAGGFLFVGSRWMAAAAFPIAFLVFMLPLPDTAVYWLERGSVLASADVTAFLFRITGTPFLREGTVFALPTIVLEVAQECSGIRSSYVLFITSLVASNIFLESQWRRLFLVAFVIPLGIVRNGFRILVLGLLCVHVGPHMIDSIVHHRGGPIFFVLSLMPLLLLLKWLRSREATA